MRRKNFFKNMSNVAKFGLLGTTLTFVFYALFMTIVMNNVPLEKYNPLTK
jgi:NhaP-type Na+/H+ or K+/H+ antiporter